MMAQIPVEDLIEGELTPLLRSNEWKKGNVERMNRSCSQ